MDLLDDWIKSRGLPEAEWSPDGRAVTIDGDVYSIDQFGECSRSLNFFLYCKRSEIVDLQLTNQIPGLLYPTIPYNTYITV